MIEVKELSKAFGPIVAVDRVSFSVAKGDVLGFLGPNGAGKSTTMKMLSCFLAPDSGTATVMGHDIVREPITVQRRLGYLAENAPAYDEMTTEGFLKFVCDARDIRGKARRDALNRIAGRCAVESVMHQPIGTLSKGFRRRVGLAQALIHNPDVLILDEPTDGLDPIQKHDVRGLIKELSANKCIVISTHILEEVDAICNRMIIIDEGRLLVDSTPDKLRELEHETALDDVFRSLVRHRRKAARAGGAA